ncbi:hypothetical protein [uncultured Ruminococcus sp.]|uniref:hypothetical protein n=1 Tax=uncultured Ruminococcus sp. TaxID=165186 RepID=UPI0025DFC7EC|nr:hypothetical protein [uncultured Ruminococcus sp.]
MGQAFRERLAESSRGRASRSRRRGEVATVPSIAQQTSDPKMRGNIQIPSVNKTNDHAQTIHVKILPRMKSTAAAR